MNLRSRRMFPPPPTFTDESQTRVALLLNNILWTVLGVGLIFTITTVIVFPARANRIPLEALVVLLALVLLYTLHRGYVRETAFALMGGLWLILSVISFISGGVRNPAFGALTVVVVMAMLVLGTRWALGFAVASTIIGAILMYFDSTGVIRPLEFFGTPIWFFLQQTVYMFVIGGFVHIAVSSLNIALERVRTNEEMVAARNKELRRQIVERDAARAEARRGEQRLQMILESANDAVITFDVDGKILYWNPQSEAIFGWTRSDIRGKYLAEAIVPDHSQNEFERWLQSFVESWENTDPDNRSTEFTAICRNRLEFPTRMTVMPMDIGSRTVFNAFLREITDENVAPARHSDVLHVESDIDLFREFLSDVSHDLKSPLAVITTSLYLLERTDDQEKKAQKIEAIRTQTRHLEQLVQNILTLSRLDYAPDMPRTETDINAMIEEVLEQFSTSIAEKNLSTTVELQSNLPQLPVAVLEFRRALINLIENAIRYTPEGGMITVGSRMQGNMIEIEVADTGVGIDEKDLPHIFERYYRTEAARGTAKSGSGLGLAIVKKITEMHNGRVDVRSRLGEGTTFQLSLPGISGI